MVSRSGLLCFILLPLLDQVMGRSFDSTESSNNSPDSHFMPNPLPPSLLQLLRSEALQQQSQHSTMSENKPEDEDDGNDNEVSKRVFCNGFTGCGGRHRNPSRRVVPVLVKRPFCNSFGCYNGKRSPGSFPIGSPASSYRMQALAQALMKGPEEEEVVVPGKRLFCNGYGGCRGSKRTLFSPWLNKMKSFADSQ